MAVTTTSTHCAYWDGQAELDWVAWLNMKMGCPLMVTHPSTNLTQRRVTSLMRPTMLPQG